MKIIKIDLENYTKEEVESIAKELLNKKVVVLPTDTIYGLSAIVTSQKVIKRIYKIKKRTSKQQKHLILLVKSFCMLRRYCYLSQKQYDYLKNKWMKSRALTVILKGRNVFGNNLKNSEIVSDDQGISVRLPHNRFLVELIKIVGEPVVSTSLNITGKENLKDISIVGEYFKKVKPDVVIDAGILEVKKPSRLEDLRNMENIKVYRA